MWRVKDPFGKSAICDITGCACVGAGEAIYQEHCSATACVRLSVCVVQECSPQMQYIHYVRDAGFRVH